MLEEALQYAKEGYRVLPVAGKRPTTPNGKTDATTSAVVIEAWWKGSPMSGIGLVIPDDIVVVDIDSKDSLKALDSFGLSLPSTAVQKTRRGWHYWYKRTSATPASRKISVFPGVDLLVNGYMVVSPTPGYSWEVSIVPSSNIADAPEWLETLISQADKEYARVDPEEILEGLPQGSRNTGLFRYACSLKARGKNSIQETKVLLREAARQAEGGSKEFPPEWTDALVERVWKTYNRKEREQDFEYKNPKPKSLAELAAEPLIPSIRIIDKLLPAYGYTLITSAPKVGKSALVQQIAACVATGTKAFGRFDVKPSGVLYLDLEQDPYEGYQRWVTILDKLGHKTMPANLYVEFSWPKLDEGGIDRLKEFLIDHPNVNLVVVDTLADFWPLDDIGGGNAYHREQRIVKQFLPLSRDYGCAVVLVHHDSKAGGKELTARASGTYALSGKASAIWHLSREENEKEGWFETTGKNIPGIKALMEYDKEKTFWTMRYYQ